MAGGCPYLVCLLALVSPDDCFLSGDPCHFDATPVGSAFSGWVYKSYPNSDRVYCSIFIHLFCLRCYTVYYNDIKKL